MAVILLSFPFSMKFSTEGMAASASLLLVLFLVVVVVFVARRAVSLLFPELLDEPHLRRVSFLPICYQARQGNCGHSSTRRPGDFSVKRSASRHSA